MCRRTSGSAPLWRVPSGGDAIRDATHACALSASSQAHITSHASFGIYSYNIAMMLTPSLARRLSHGACPTRHPLARRRPPAKLFSHVWSCASGSQDACARNTPESIQPVALLLTVVGGTASHSDGCATFGRWYMSRVSIPWRSRRHLRQSSPAPAPTTRFAQRSPLGPRPIHRDT